MASKKGDQRTGVHELRGVLTIRERIGRALERKLGPTFLLKQRYEVEGKIYYNAVRFRQSFENELSRLGAHVSFDGIIDTQYVEFPKDGKGEITDKFEEYSMRLRRLTNGTGQHAVITRQLTVKGPREETGKIKGHLKVKAEYEVDFLGQNGTRRPQAGVITSRDQIREALIDEFGAIGPEVKQRKVYSFSQNSRWANIHVALERYNGVEYIEFEATDVAKDRAILDLITFIKTNKINLGKAAGLEKITVKSLSSKSTQEFVSKILRKGTGRRYV